MQLVLARRNLFFLLPILYLSIAWAGIRWDGLTFPSNTSSFHHNWSSPQMQGALAALDSLPEDSNRWFLTAGICAQCHGHDTSGLAMVDPNGRDINPTDLWRATMMANSARDPFWRAQVSHEGIIDPAHSDAIENECTSCHAPLGHFSHYYESPGSHYTISQLENDALGLDGVSCMACHSMRTDSLGVTFSGQIRLDTHRVAYGPYPGPFQNPMIDSINVTPEYGPQIEDARLCAGCHTLITQTIDLQNNPTGTSFVEQATYHEWVNSQYYTNGDICQKCHVPQINEPIIIAVNNPPVLFGRRPYGLHELAGSNVFMLRLMRDNIDTLGIPADTVHFDSVIARTERMLQNDAIRMYLALDSTASDTAYYKLRLENRAGHKFPSGYPSRRAFVEFVVRDAMGDTLFKSGILGSDYEVEGQDPDYEPHYDVIRSQDEVQVYEFIMGDVNGDVTTTLRRAASHLKDNRLPPIGMTTTHYNYDTVEIAGLAASDPNFNLDGTTEGTGADEIRYNVPLNGYNGNLQVSARFYYQTVRPGWMDETFASSSGPIDHFEAMFNAADKSPVLVEELTGLYWPVGLEEGLPLEVSIWPNPSPDAWVFLQLADPLAAEEIRVFDVQGKMVWRQRTGTQGLYQVALGDASGVYWVEVRGMGQRVVKKVVRR